MGTPLVVRPAPILVALLLAALAVSATAPPSPSVAVISDASEPSAPTTGDAAITAALASQLHGVAAQVQLTASMEEAIPVVAAALGRTRTAVSEVASAIDAKSGPQVAPVLTALLDGFDAERSCLLPPCGEPFDPPSSVEHTNRPASNAAIAASKPDESAEPTCGDGGSGASTCEDAEVQNRALEQHQQQQQQQAAYLHQTAAAAAPSPRLVNQGDLEDALRQFLMAMRLRVEQVLPRSMRASTRGVAAGVTADATTQAARALLLLGRAAGSNAVSPKAPVILEAITTASALQHDVFAATSAAVRVAVSQWRMGANSTEAPLAAVPCASLKYGPQHAINDVTSAFNLLNRVFVTAGSPHSFEPPPRGGDGRGQQAHHNTNTNSNSRPRSPTERQALAYNMEHGLASSLGTLHEELFSPAREGPFSELLRVLRNASVACTNVPAGPPRGWKPPPTGELDPVLHAPYAAVEGGCTFDYNKGVVRYLGPSMDGAEQCRVAAWRDVVAALHTTILVDVIPAVLKLMVMQAVAAP